MKLSTYFTYEEMIRSDTAKRLGIDNTPNTKQVANLKKLCVEVLDRVRAAYGKPIIVSSGFRCPELNAAVGGNPNSQHCANCGAAADIHSVSDETKENKRIFIICQKLIKEGKIDTGQLIWEYGDMNGPSWCHISTRGGHHNQVFRIP